MYIAGFECSRAKELFYFFPRRFLPQQKFYVKWGSFSLCFYQCESYKHFFPSGFIPLEIPLINFKGNSYPKAVHELFYFPPTSILPTAEILCKMGVFSPVFPQIRSCHGLFPWEFIPLEIPLINCGKTARLKIW